MSETSPFRRQADGSVGAGVAQPGGGRPAAPPAFGRPPVVGHVPEAPAEVDFGTALGRRGFLKAAGFSLAGLAGCARAPVERAIPLLVQPEEVVPGRALWYASTCGGCTAGCGLLVKCRDGRPIKLEGNPRDPLSRGGLCAVGQASVLELYDSRRYRAPLLHGRETTWETIDRDVMAAFELVRQRRGAVRVLTGTLTSPTLRARLAAWLGTFPDAAHYVYDPLSASALLDAHERTHGRRVLPRFRFDRASVIVGIDADFLGTWISPVEFTGAWRDSRSLEGDPPRCAYHVQIEPRLSLTGTKADARVRVAPAEIPAVLQGLALRLAARAGAADLEARLGSAPGAGPHPADTRLAAALDDLAARLWAARGKSLVVCGSQDVAVQVLCNTVNHLLGSYGQTIDLDAPSFQRQGRDGDVERLLAELRAGTVQALVVAGVNPAYDLPAATGFARLVRDVPLVVSVAGAPDETSALATHVCPDHHFLESWADAEPVAGRVSVTQPVIAPLGDTRAFLETLAAWMGDRRPAYDLLREAWRSAVYPRRTEDVPFDRFWDTAVHDGVVAVTAPPAAPAVFAAGAVHPVDPPRQAGAPDGRLALVLYPTVGLLDGRHAHNPWLQELPDPITKVTWDNCACLSPAAAARLQVREGDLVRLEADGDGADPVAVELPVYVQPGQHDEVVAVALGYGRAGTERFAAIGPRWIDARPGVGPGGLVGVSAAPLLALEGGTLRYDARRVRLVPVGRRLELATTQRHHSIQEPRRISSAGARHLVRETTVARLQSGAIDPGPLERGHEDLWPPDHPTPGHRWGMVIDLHACTGCSACVVACQAENNVPVVGRDEVRRQREMHWLRIDRYYTAGAGEPGGEVDVVHQPMLCQHCAHAPCESVCPVLATVHSEDGLNQQVYNRCVGTRYCANNCPYKVRRFNWFTYARTDERENLVLNPDVTVRTRGVMEKCSFCIQRIQEARIAARMRGDPVRDGDVRPACEQSCPARAIVFGDLNDPESRVAKLARDSRRFVVLEELNVRPSVHYLAVVRNRPAAGADASHA
jgi:molybdopterin-containing oxidoreductase family iron-sulfur binding subunit